MPVLNTYALGTPTADQFRRLSGTSDEGAITTRMLAIEARLAALEGAVSDDDYAAWSVAA